MKQTLITFVCSSLPSVFWTFFSRCSSSRSHLATKQQCFYLRYPAHPLQTLRVCQWISLFSRELKVFPEESLLVTVKSLWYLLSSSHIHVNAFVIGCYLRRMKISEVYIVRHVSVVYCHAARARLYISTIIVAHSSNSSSKSHPSQMTASELYDVITFHFIVLNV